MINHITYKSAWEAALEKGRYETASLDKEGFIHCSEDHQVDATLDRYYRGEKGLVKLVIDPSRLRSQLIHEWSPSNTETFPHIYGPVNLDAVQEVIDLP